MVLRALRIRRPRSALGQALVETALILPLLLILLLGAIDFGRAFFGWVGIHQVARIGANFAATNPDVLETTPEGAALRTELVALLDTDVDGLNCIADRNSTGFGMDDLALQFTSPGGAPVDPAALGDYATMTIACDFSPVTPLIGGLLGEPIPMSAEAIFPVRDGCINCPTPVPATPPPPPIQCFPVPTMEGMSVAGARLAWVSAGFDIDNFTPLSGQNTDTVDEAFVTEDDPLSTCTFPTFAVYTSSVTVTTLPPDPPTGGCATVPNLIGLPVADARDAWTAATFDAANFNPDTTDDARVVTDQTTVEPSEPGVGCLDPLTTTIDLVTGDPWPAAPPRPCRVPNMIELTRPQGLAEWIDEGFDGANFAPNGGNWIIRSQSLVGGTYVTCTASVRVSQNP